MDADFGSPVLARRRSEVTRLTNLLAEIDRDRARTLNRLEAARILLAEAEQEHA